MKGYTMKNEYFLHIPPSEKVIENIVLKENEHIACTNATVIVDSNDEICGWVDNSKFLTIIAKEN